MQSGKIFANGIWKSGNNLLLKILKLSGLEYAEFGLAASSLNGNFYLARQLIRGAGLQRYPISIGLDMSVNVSSKWLEKKVHRLNGDYFSGHAAYSDSLLNILMKSDVKTIQIIRDPRDVLISYSDWIVKRPDYYTHNFLSSMPEKDRCIALLKGYECNGQRIESLATVLDRSYGWITKKSDNIHVVRFEDIIGEKGGGDEGRQEEALRRVLSFLSMYDEKKIQSIKDNMFGGTHTFSAGRSGRWRDSFDDDLKYMIEEELGDRLSSWGYDVP